MAKNQNPGRERETRLHNIYLAERKCIRLEWARCFLSSHQMVALDNIHTYVVYVLLLIRAYLWRFHKSLLCVSYFFSLTMLVALNIGKKWKNKAFQSTYTHKKSRFFFLCDFCRYCLGWIGRFFVAHKYHCSFNVTKSHFATPTRYSYGKYRNTRRWGRKQMYRRKPFEMETIWLFLEVRNSLCLRICNWNSFELHLQRIGAVQVHCIGWRLKPFTIHM